MAHTTSGRRGKKAEVEGEEVSPTTGMELRAAVAKAAGWAWAGSSVALLAWVSCLGACLDLSVCLSVSPSLPAPAQRENATGTHR